MNRGARILLWTAAALAVLLIAAALALPAFLDPNRYRETIETRIEAVLGREVSLGEIRLRVLPRVTVVVERISVGEGGPRGGDPVLTADSLRGRIKILPLLRRQVEIAAVEIVRPTVRVVRRADGSWNFDDLLAAFAAGGKEEPGAAPSGAGFAVSRLDLRDGTIRLHDLRTRRGETVATELRDLNLSLRDLRPGEDLRFRLESSLPPHAGQRVAARGKVGLESTPTGFPFAAEVEIQDFELPAAGPHLEEFLDLKAAGGSVTLDVEGKGETGGPIDLAGGIRLEHIAPGIASAGRGAPAPTLNLDLEFDLSMAAARDRYEFRRLEWKGGKSDLRLRGTVDLSAPRTHLDVEILPSRFLLDDLNNLLQGLGTSAPMDISSPDPVEVALRFRGHPDAIREAEFEGSLKVSHLTLRHPSLASPLEKVEGRVEIGPNRFAVQDFSGALGGSDLAGELEVKNFAAPEVDFRLRSRRADLGQALSFLTPEAGGAAGGTAEAGEEWQADLDRIRAKGTLEIGEGTLGSLAFSRFQGTMAMEGGRVRFQPVEFGLYGGSCAGEAEVDPGKDPTPFRVRARLEKVDSLALLSENLEVRDLKGTLAGELNLRGTASGVEATVRGATGDGELRVTDGSVVALNVLELLAKVSGVFGETTLERLSKRIAAEETPFSSLAGKFQLTEGILRSDDLTLKSTDLDLAGSGSLGLLDGGLNLSLQVLLSPEVSGSMRQEKSQAAELFWNSRAERVEIPMRLTGTLASPSPSVDFRRAGGTFLRSRVDELLRGKTPAPAQPPAQAPAPAAEPGAAPPAADAGGLSIEIGESRFSGNFLLPDAKVSGVFRGAGLARADLRLLDSGGNEILSEPDAFPEIAAAPDGATEIPFSKKIDAKRIAGRGSRLTASITLFDRSGHSLTRQSDIRR
ncbi:MAG: AsmA family protein [Acidobacteria bacterium]|nr:AsmA family protein [Acidobacteriota bacterium]